MYGQPMMQQPMMQQPMMQQPMMQQPMMQQPMMQQPMMMMQPVQPVIQPVMMQPMYQPPPPPPVYYPPPPPPPPSQPQTIIISGGNNQNNSSGTNCGVCGQETGNMPRKKIGTVAILWCICMAFTTGCCFIPLCVDSCKDTQLVCVKCQTVKMTIPANCC